MIRTYSFDDKLHNSTSYYKEVQNILSDIFQTQINLQKSVLKDDKLGIDYWCVLANEQKISLDLKKRDKDFKKNDVALETLSVVEDNKIGWTLDDNKKNDYVLWFWEDSNKYFLIPFTPLRIWFSLNFKHWKKQYLCCKQKTMFHNYNYHSECVFVPIDEIISPILSLGGPLYLSKKLGNGFYIVYKKHLNNSIR